METITLSVLLNATPEEVYNAWMNEKSHASIIGDKAMVANKVGGKFEAWDGYIKGTTIALEPYKRILQNWRTIEFSDHDSDSELELIFEDKNEKTLLTLNHRNIPVGQGKKYKSGWQEHYFEGLKKYFK